MKTPIGATGVKNPATSLTARVDQYNTVLGKLLDKHAPIRKKLLLDQTQSGTLLIYMRLRPNAGD